MSLELYCLSWHPRAAKALIPAKLGGVDVKVHEVAWPTENKSPEYLKMNPAGKVRRAQRHGHSTCNQLLERARSHHCPSIDVRR